MRKCRIINGANYSVRHHQDGQEIVFNKGAGAPGASGSTTRYVILGIFPEFLTARAAGDARTDAPIIFVAKPKHLRVAVGADNNERTVNVAARGAAQITSIERIDPPYAVGGEIYAQKSTNKTGVMVTAFQTPFEVEYIEQVPGRNWKTQLRVYPICLEGVVYEAAFAAGPPLEA